MDIDPDWLTRMASGPMGLTFTEVSGDQVLGSVTVTPAMHQPNGIVHGGVYCAVIETAASVGGGVWFGDRGVVVGASNHTNFVRAVRDGVLEVKAVPVHRGRTQQLWRVDITDSEGRLVSTGEVRLANLPARD